MGFSLSKNWIIGLSEGKKTMSCGRRVLTTIYPEWEIVF
jgi:hypothetical protein